MDETSGIEEGREGKEKPEPVVGALGFTETRSTNIGAILGAAVSLAYLTQYLTVGPGLDEIRAYSPLYISLFSLLEAVSILYLVVSRFFPGSRMLMSRIFSASLILWGSALTCVDLQSNIDLSAYGVTLVGTCAFLGAPLAFYIPLILISGGCVLGAFILSPMGYDFIDGFVPIIAYAFIALGLAAMRWKERRELFVAWKEVAERTARLQELSFRDYLTGLYNRRFFVESLDNAIRAARRQKTGITVTILDLDHFKKINDSLGHGTGDQVLQKVAKILDESKRASDILARYGGEEFIFLFPASPPDDAMRAMERMADAVRNWTFPNVPWRVTFSAGVAVMREFETVEDLLRRADMALYAAKQEGRDKVVLAA